MGTALSITISGVNGTKSIRNLADVKRVSDHNSREGEVTDEYYQRPGPKTQCLFGTGDVLEDLKNVYQKEVQPFYDAYNDKRVKMGKGKAYKKNAFETQIEKNEKYDAKQTLKNKNKSKTADLMTEIIFKAGSYEEIIERMAKGESEELIRTEHANICRTAAILFLNNNPNFKASTLWLHNDEKGAVHIQMTGIHVEKLNTTRGLGINMNHNATFKHEDDATKLKREQARMLAKDEETHDQSRALYDDVRKSASWESGTLTYLHNGFKNEIVDSLKNKYPHLVFNETQDERGTFYSTDAYINYVEKRDLNERESKKHIDLKKQTSEIESQINQRVVIKQNLDSEVDKIKVDKLNLLDEVDELKNGNYDLANRMIVEKQKRDELERKKREQKEFSSKLTTPTPTPAPASVSEWQYGD